MDENNNESNILLQNDYLKKFNLEKKKFLNPEIISMRQDLLFFKNDILKDMRLLEEKINSKFTEQNITNSEQFFEYEKKIEDLTNQVNIFNANMIDNSNLAAKINDFQVFQSKAESHFISINSRIYSIQKENKEFFNNTEKALDDNIRYPGLIGKNGRFQNFRKFVDYILSYFKEYNAFREEVRNFDIISLKKKIISDLRDFRSAINEGYRSTLTMVQKSKRELESQLEDTLKQNKQTMKENEQKFDKLRNTIIEDLSDYQNKFEKIEKNINNKYNEQLNEIENFKNKFLEDMNNFKADFESIKKLNESKNENDELKNILKYINNTYIPEGIPILKENVNNGNNNISNCDEVYDKLIFDETKETFLPVKYKSIDYHKYITAKGKNNFILKERLLNKKNFNKINFSKEKNINIMDKYHIINENNNTDKINIFDNNPNTIMNKTQINARFKSFISNHNLLNYIDVNNDSIRGREQLSFTQDYIMNKKKGIDLFNSIFKKPVKENNLNKGINMEKRNAPKNNYSVSNIPNIKIKKMIFPDFLTKRNSKITKPNSFSSNNKNIQNRTNNKPSSARSILNEGINRRRKTFDITKINKDKNYKIKDKRFSESSKTIDRNIEHKIKDSLKSFLVLNRKQKNNSHNNLINLKKRQKMKLSFEKKGNKKNECI